MAEVYPIHFAGIAIETLPTGAHRWPCAAHGATVTAFLKPNGQWAVSASCRACNRAVLQPVLDAIEAAKKEKAPPVDGDGASDVVWREAGNADVSSHHSIAPARGNGRAQEGNDDFLRRVPPHSEDAEKAVLGAIFLEDEAIGRIPWLTIEMFYREVHREIFKAIRTLRDNAQPIDIVTLRATLERAGKWGFVSPQYLAEIISFVPGASAIEHYAAIVRDMHIKRQVAERATALVSLAYNGVSADALVGELHSIATRANQAVIVTGNSAIVAEDYDTAMAANAEYLKRVPIVDRLFFSQTISLVVGGKHHGKTTIARTAAMCVMRGQPFLGREVKRGPVIYAASSDEVPVTRMELLRMGWDSRKDPLRIVHIRPDGPDVDQVLGEISELAIKEGALFIVLDMLFDFAQIRDEMSYAGTRQAIGKVQALADRTLASVVPTHHSPKYMTDAATAGQSALGSQGIAARFSPIILSRKWAEGLYSISSTTTRDPRGEALAETCIEVSPNGWASSAGEFKTWMKWKVYAPRVMGLIEGGEPGSGYTVGRVAQELDISRPDAQNTLYRLHLDGKLEREKKGRGYRYWMAVPRERVFAEVDEMLAQKHGGESQD